MAIHTEKIQGGGMQIKYLVIIVLFAMPCVESASGIADEYIGTAQLKTPAAPRPPAPPNGNSKFHCEMPTLAG
jgi:hypothetical protein